MKHPLPLRLFRAPAPCFGRPRFALGARRRGVSTYLFVLALPMMIGLLGIVIDLGTLYSKRAQAQRAADAGAIAGAMESQSSAMIASAKEYTARNGYADGESGATVTVTPSIGVGTAEVCVRVARPEAVYFAPLLEGLLLAAGKSEEAQQFSRNVSAQATARARTALPLGLGGVYGVADPARSPVNNSIFGPDMLYELGDAYAGRWLQDGVTPNPLYAKDDGAQEYTLHVTTDYLNKYNTLALQIFDPDCYNGPNGYDEIWGPNPRIQPQPSGPWETTTVYELYSPDGSLIANATYGNDPASDGRWVTPEGFSFNPTVAGDYRLKVKSTSGSSENGFQLRAGPATGTALSDETWNQTYGDKNGTDPTSVALQIDSKDHLQLNFTQNGTVKFRLGYVPASQAGKTIGVSKFDVDVGSQSITYTCDALPGQSFPGVIPPQSNGTWSTDNISLPAGYAGGNWYVEYVAGRGDSSTWTLSGMGDGESEVRLIK